MLPSPRHGNYPHLPLVVSRVRKFVEKDLEYVPPGGSKWISTIGVPKKSDGYLRLCSDYDGGVNHA